MTLTVSQLNNQIKSILESTFERVTVRGEISRITYHSSGHVYFDIKDANSTLNCVMFRGNVSKLKFRLEQGLDIVLDATVSVYIPRGSYQLNCFSATPAGEGALALAYEQLKKKLEAKGYFDSIHKKPLPKFPKHIVVVTSKTGAALQDMLRVANKRWGLVKITLVNSLVQGESAAFELEQAIQRADKIGADILIVGRGGGSIEDLWCFNEERVAEAIFACKTPVISAVGHEIDYVISDFVADVRAATPSNAIELSLPDGYEVLTYLSERISHLDRVYSHFLEIKSEKLGRLKSLFVQNSPKKKLDLQEQNLKDIAKRVDEKFSLFLEKKEGAILPLRESLKSRKDLIVSKKSMELHSLKSTLEALDPKKKVRKGFSQVVKDREVVELKSLNVDDPITLIDQETKIEAKVTGRKEL